MNTVKFLSKPLAVAAACYLGLSATPASAQLSVERGMGVDRPAEELFILQTPYTQPAGSTQMIIGADHQRSGDIRNTHIMGRVEYGLTDRIQLQGEIPVDIADRSSGFTAQTGVSRAQIGAMASLTKPESSVALSAGMNIEYPFAGTSNDVTGDRPSEGPTFKPELSAATGVGPMTVQASAQAELGQPTRAMNYGIGSMYSAGNWVPSLELSSRAIENQRSEYYVTPGVTYKFSDRTQLGVGAGIGVGQQSQGNSQLMAKFSLRLP